MRIISTIFAVTLACSLLAVQARGQQPVPEKRADAFMAQRVVVPTGNGVPVVTDGIFTPGEWDDALLISLGETFELRVKEYRGVVFIGLRGPAGIGPADLFVSVPGGPICQLHRSAQLAEAIVPPTGELPPLRKFGLSPDWYANEQRWDIEEAERLRKAGKTPLEMMRAASYPSDGIEFAIRRSKFPGERWLIRLEGTAFLTPDIPAVLAYPPDAGKESVQRLTIPQGPPTAPKPRVLDVSGLKWLELRLPAAGDGGAAMNDRAVVEQMIRDSIGWAMTKDRALAERIIAHDPDLFMFNPGTKSVTGWDVFVKNFDFWMDPRFKATSFDVRDLRLKFSRSGDAVWWSAILDDLAEWDGKPTGWKDTRWTGVAEKRDGQWVIVQMHFSFDYEKVQATQKKSPK